MTNRHAYIGDTGLSGGAPSIAIQPETIAYLARFSTAPSKTYRNAVNQAVFKWKQAGLLSLIQDLYLLCADTQADSLRNFFTAARDATLTGSPTFTALKGFGGLSTSNYVSLPYSTTSIVLASSAAGAAGKWDAQALSTAGAIRMASSGNANDFGGIVGQNSVGSGVPALSLLMTPNPSLSGFSALSTGVGVSVQPFVTGTTMASGNPNYVTPSIVALGTASIGGGVVSSPLRVNNSGGSTIVTQISAYFTAPSMTVAQLRLFLSILQGFLDDIGAL